MNLSKYGQEFYDLSISVTRLVCLDLFDNADPRAIEQIEELTEDMDGGEFARLFGLADGDYADDRSEIDLECLLETLRRGWLVSASIAKPRNIYFDEAGKVSSYSMGGIAWPTRMYKKTLEEALDAIIVQAKAWREAEFSKARKEQGLPEPAGEEV